MTEATASDDVTMPFPWGDAKGVERAVRAAHFVGWTPNSHSYAVLSSVADAVEKGIRHGFSQGRKQNAELVEVLREARKLSDLGYAARTACDRNDLLGQDSAETEIMQIHARIDAVLAKAANGGEA